MIVVFKLINFLGFFMVQVSVGATRLRLTTQASGFVGRREFSVFNEFSNKVKGEASKYALFPFLTFLGYFA